MEDNKKIDWEERRFEILKVLVASNTQNARNSAVINGMVSASKLIIDHYRRDIEKE